MAGRRAVLVAACGGVLLVAAAVLSGFSSLKSFHLLALGIIAAELGVACFWWPLVGREQIPLRPVSTWTIRTLGVFYICALIVLGVILVAGARADATEVMPWVVSVFVVPAAGAACLLTRPRLLLPWCTGGIVTGLTFYLSVLTQVRPGLGAEHAIFTILVLFLLVFPSGILLGLPFAWLCVKRAEAKGRG